MISLVDTGGFCGFFRNGDYPPTRFQAQAEAVQTVFTAKTDSNPESAVGLMSMAGNSPSLLVTPTNDLGKLLSSLSKVNISGISSLSTSISIAQLSLKHRENKNQRQRIVVFIGSPLSQEADSKENLVKLGKKLRKNNVLIDVITFGDEGRENDDKLNALIEAVGGDESHLVSIPPGPRFLSDVILSSPILFDGDANAAGGSGDVGGGGFGGDGVDGIDPNMDPELAMAIRMSLQEAQEAAARANPQASASSESTAPATTVPADEPSGPSGEPSGSATLLPSALIQPLSNANDQDIPMVPGDAGVSGEQQIADEEEDEDDELRKAMALSRGDDVEMLDEGDDEDEDDEAAIARAIAMSLEEAKEEDDKEPKS
ncbi:26S proteasome regulatory subunit N10 [Kwoniella mangroviensis CBS 10435]|uniref:26S proteasome regulatory subunit N10 n=1 Tax=Kwoniella mangroviensis CBS 10435 TaxID=1331196 RepID=A0A1B9IX79_9TREE|nr:26S proteasome regulatory subunit N10 [Kwoniella mangroviensis CBS 10435]